LIGCIAFELFAVGQTALVGLYLTNEKRSRYLVSFAGLVAIPVIFTLCLLGLGLLIWYVGLPVPN
jgi:hypothetical protein